MALKGEYKYIQLQAQVTNQPRILYSFILRPISMSLHLCASVPLLSFTRLPAKSRTCISLETNGSENSAPRPVKLGVGKKP